MLRFCRQPYRVSRRGKAVLLLSSAIALMRIEYQDGGGDAWEQGDDAVVAGVICPVPECGALVIACGPTCYAGLDCRELWEFECFRCGSVFAVPQNELILQVVPKGWLYGKIHVT